MSVGPMKTLSLSADRSVSKKNLVVAKKRRHTPSAEPALLPYAPTRVVEAAKPASRPIKAVTPPQESARSPAKPLRAAAKPAIDPPKRLPAHEPIRIELKLRVDERQRACLESLVRAPKALANLLRSYPLDLKTKADASAFLLNNRRELDGVINHKSRDRDVDMLTELLLRWSGNPPESVGIDFDDASLSHDNKVYLPLPGLHSIEIFEREQLEDQRRGKRYALPFTLFEEGRHFYLALTLEPSQKSATRPPRHQTLDVNGKVKEIKLKPGHPLPYIIGPRYSPREPRQRVLFSRYSGVFGGIKTMNWGGLSGWGVNGGLPSLGKRAR